MSIGFRNGGFGAVGLRAFSIGFTRLLENGRTRAF